MTDPDLSAAILAALRADGGACEAVFRAPLFALADWFRERGRDDFADALTGEDVDGYAWRLRDAAYLAGSNRERRRMRAYTREVLAARAAEG